MFLGLLCVGLCMMIAGYRVGTGRGVHSVGGSRRILRIGI